MQLSSCVIQTLKRWFPDADLARANIISSGRLAWLVKKMNRAGITLRKTILFGEGYYDPFSPRGIALIAHELKHVLQYEEEGTIKFTLKYLWDWGRQGGKYSKEIHFEKEAYDLEEKIRKHLESEFLENGNKGQC